MKRHVSLSNSLKKYSSLGILLILISAGILFSGCLQNADTGAQTAVDCKNILNVWVTKTEFGNPGTMFMQNDRIYAIVESEKGCLKTVKASLVDGKGKLISEQEYNIPAGMTGYKDYNPTNNLQKGKYKFEFRYDNTLIKTINITVSGLPGEIDGVVVDTEGATTGVDGTGTDEQADETEEQLSEQPNQEKFKEYFTDIHLGKLPLGVQIGPPNFPAKASVFTSADQLCLSLDIIKPISETQLATATYSVTEKKDIFSKSIFPMALTQGNTAGCEEINQFAAGKYERKIYIDDVPVAVLPFEVK